MLSAERLAVRSDQKGQCQLSNLDWLSVDVLSHSRIQMNCIFSTKFSQSHSVEGILPKSLGRGVPHGSQNPDPISDQNLLFFIPLFRPDPKNLYPISDLDWLPFAQCTT